MTPVQAGAIVVRKVEDAVIISTTSDETGSEDDVEKDEPPKTFSSSRLYGLGSELIVQRLSSCMRQDGVLRFLKIIFMDRNLRFGPFSVLIIILITKTFN